MYAVAVNPGLMFWRQYGTTAIRTGAQIINKTALHRVLQTQRRKHAFPASQSVFCTTKVVQNTNWEAENKGMGLPSVCFCWVINKQEVVVDIIDGCTADG